MLQEEGPLRATIRSRLRGFDTQALERSDTRRAAVAVVVVEGGHGADLPGMPRHASWQDAPALLLTRRAAHLRRHAGQWALPGGRVDDGETAEDAALRELEEEVALQLSPADVLGRLDDYPTRSGFVITPIVVWGGAARGMRPQPDEVASIHRIPASELLREDAPLLDPAHDDDGPPVLSLPVGQGWIAAPTAAVLYQFRELCLLGRTTRVAHFDQPEFAWR